MELYQKQMRKFYWESNVWTDGRTYRFLKKKIQVSPSDLNEKQKQEEHFIEKLIFKHTGENIA